MRDIRFRAWAEASQEMVTGEYNSDEYILTIDGGRVVLLEQSLDEYGGYSPAVAEIMQHTGLKDKNGREIYEGDIVTYVHGSKGNYKVEWTYASFEIIGPVAAYPMGDVDYSGVEIIGNIHQNPELLNDTAEASPHK